MNHRYVVNVTAIDRPGIVAGVSSVITRLKGNIESCSQTVLEGYFTLILTFSTGEQYAVDYLKEQILSEKGMEACEAIVIPVCENMIKGETSDRNLYVISAFGRDCEGVVSQFTRYLCSKEINIVDLYANITSEGKFVLICQVQIAPCLDLKNIQYDLEALGEQAGFTVRIQHNNVFVATNQIRLDR